jgi:predicted RNA-binding Zn-ribbon protein involved in translation (DUF1610 family)
VRTWITDVRDLVAREEATLPLAAQRRGEFTRALVESATSRRAGSAWLSAVRCMARAGRKPCRSWTLVARPEPGRVEWSCPACGEQGIVTGFEGGEHDLSAYIPATKTLLWGIDEESRDLLLAATPALPALRAIVARASPVAEVEGFLRIDATLAELDAVYSLVEQLTDATRSRQRIELLEELRGSLCDAMDRF